MALLAYIDRVLFVLDVRRVAIAEKGKNATIL